MTALGFLVGFLLGAGAMALVVRELNRWRM